MRALFALLTLLLVTALPVAFTTWLGLVWGLLAALATNLAVVTVSARALKEEG